MKPEKPRKPGKRITADYLRRHWVFQPPTTSELAEVARLEQLEREQSQTPSSKGK